MTRRRTNARRRGLAFFALMLATAVSLVSAAQTKTPGGRATTNAPAKKPKAKPPAHEGDAGAAAPLAGREPVEVVETARDGGKAGAVVNQKTLDGGTRVFRFGEVEVEGRLKSPQIVYFLRRVRAEFSANNLGHRSFMSELGETKHEPSF